LTLADDEREPVSAVAGCSGLEIDDVVAWTWVNESKLVF